MARSSSITRHRACGSWPLSRAYINGTTELRANVTDERYYTTPELSVDGAPWSKMVLVQKQTWNYSSFIDIAKLTDGRHNASIRTTDSSGNLVIKVLNFTSDVTPPLAFPQFPKDGSVLSGNLTLTVWGSDNIGISTMFFQMGPFTSIPLAYNSVTGLYESPLDTLPIPDGRYDATIATKDLANNYYYLPRKMSVVVDNSAPMVKLVSPVAGGVVHGNVTVVVNVTDITTCKVTYSVGQLGERDLSVPWNTSEISDGQYTLTVRVRDLANHLTTINVPVTVDNTAPIILPIHVPEETEHITGIYALKAKVEDLTLNVTSLSLYTQFSQYLICADYEKLFECNIDTGLRTEGNYTLILRAEDATGRYTVIARNITLDSSPPSIAILPRPIEILSGNVLFKVRAYDVSPQVTLWLMIDNSTWGLMGFDAKRSEYVYTWHTTQTDNGRHKVNIRAIDAIGNEKVYAYEYVVDNMQWGWVYLLMVLALVCVIAILLRRDVEIEEVIEEPTPQIVVVQQPVPVQQPQPTEGEVVEAKKGLGKVLTRIATRRRRDITPAKELIPPKEEGAQKVEEGPKEAPMAEGAKRSTSPEERKRILRERAAERRARRR